MKLTSGNLRSRILWALDWRAHRLRDASSVALRMLIQDDATNRRRLGDVRREAAYESAFADENPLVSVVIPTVSRPDELVNRSLPSVLGQSHQRLEVIVVGHAAPPDVAAAIESLGDDRIKFTNLAYRAPEPDPHRRWLIGSVTPRNVGCALATGSWVVDFDDDDELRPRAIESGLAAARERRLEVSYGRYVCHRADGRTETVGCDPPEFGRFAWHGAVMHAGLRFFERERAAAAFGVPNDWFRTEAMLRAGVRFGMHDEIVCDYYPSMRGRN